MTVPGHRRVVCRGCGLGGYQDAEGVYHGDRDVEPCPSDDDFHCWEAHAGTVQPRDGGGFTWECVCGARPDPVTSWGSFDGAALALQRHIERKG